MDEPRPDTPTLEQLAWLTLVACIATVPLAISILPGMDLPFAVSVFAFPQTVALAVGLALALVLWAGALWTKQTHLVGSKPLIAFAAFALWSVVATAAGLEPLRSLLGRSVSALSLTHIIMYSVLVFLVMQLVNSQHRMRVLTWSVVVSGTLVALLTLTQQLLGIDIFALPIESWIIDRGFGTIGNPDQLGTFLVLPVMLSLVLAFSEETKNRRVGALACLVVLLAAAIGTLTRGAWIAIFFGGLIAAGLLWKSLRVTKMTRWPLLVGLVCLATVALALVMSDQTDLASRFVVPPARRAQSTGGTLDTINAVSSDRINVWRASMRIVAEKPLVGTGPAAFELGWYPNAIAPSSSGGTGALADDPHSFIIFVLTATGIPGLLAYLVAGLSALGYGVRTTIARVGRGPLSGNGLYYVAWFVAAVALQIALLLAAISTPIVMYTFLSFAVLLLPTAKTPQPHSTWLARQLPAVAAATLALVLVGLVLPNASAEIALARTLRDGSLDRAQEAAASTRWNTDIQRQYYRLRVSRLSAALASGTSSARTDLQAAGHRAGGRRR